MADIEKVMKGLGCCLNGNVCNEICPYSEFYYDNISECTGKLMEDAFELLKAQQPKKPHYTMLKYIVNGKEVSVRHPECPKCIDENKLYLWDAEIEKGQAFCKRCGQAIDWSKDGEQE